MNTTDIEWENRVRAEWDLYDNGRFGHLEGAIQIIEELLTSRDTYWKERIEAVEAILMKEYKNALQSNEDGEANGYAHSLAIVKDLHREFIHEDNLK